MCHQVYYRKDAIFFQDGLCMYITKSGTKDPRYVPKMASEYVSLNALLLQRP